MEVLGLDIGGSGIKAAPVDIKKGKFLADRYRLATPQPATPERMMETITQVVDFFDWKGPIGCGFPAVIKEDIVQTAANIDDSWIGCQVGTMISEQTGCPTHIINDVDAAGLAEMRFGAGVGKKGTIIMLAFGTGIGSSIFTDGELLRNTELGHVLLKNGKKSEVYASNAARKRKDLTWNEWVERVNKIFKYFDSLFWPDMYIFGGGVVKHHEHFLPYIKSNAKIVPAKLLNHAGIIGSALAYEYSEAHARQPIS